jgi:hypothetical protein
MLIDCEKCDWKIDDIVRGLDDGRYDYRNLMCDLCMLKSSEIGENLDPRWNCLEHFEAGRTKLLHFTDMDMQPWRHQHNPLKSIWRSYYRAAVEAGAVDPALVEKGIASGWLLPDLADDLQFAPARLATGSPMRGALAGTPSVHQRSLELEATALRAELGVARLEAEILRTECHKQFQGIGQVRMEMKKQQDYVADLEEQVRAKRALYDQVEDLKGQVSHLHSLLADTYASWTWKIGRAVTKPAQVVRKLKRPAA